MFLFEIELVPLGVVWGFMGAIGIVGLILSSIRWWLGVPTLVLLTFFAFLFSIDLYDDLYPHIQRQDPYYILQLNLGIALGFLLNLVGMPVYLVRRIGRKNDRSSQ